MNPAADLDGAGLQSATLLQAIKDYENNKWKVIGQKVGKPAKVCFDLHSSECMCVCVRARKIVSKDVPGYMCARVSVSLCAVSYTHLTLPTIYSV